jgi:hypothetical protein
MRINVADIENRLNVITKTLHKKDPPDGPYGMDGCG